MYKVKVCIKTNQNLLSSRISIDRLHFIWYVFLCSHLLDRGNEWDKCYPQCLIVLICISGVTGCVLGARIRCSGWAPCFLTRFCICVGVLEVFPGLWCARLSRGGDLENFLASLLVAGLPVAKRRFVQCSDHLFFPLDLPKEGYSSPSVLA